MELKCKVEVNKAIAKIIQEIESLQEEPSRAGVILILRNSLLDEFSDDDNEYDAFSDLSMSEIKEEIDLPFNV